MLIDYILDRRAGDKYNAKELYDYCQYMGSIHGDLYWNVARALDAGTNKDIQRELCKYVIKSGYNPDICDYINSVNWL